MAKGNVKKNKGFTLLEVLVALAVFAAAAGMLLLTDGTAIRQVDHLQTKALADWIGMNRIIQFKALATWPEVGQNELDLTFGARKWHVVEKVEKTPNPHFLRVIEQVYAAEGGEDSPMIRQITGYVREQMRDSATSEVL